MLMARGSACSPNGVPSRGTSILLYIKQIPYHVRLSQVGVNPSSHCPCQHPGWDSEAGDPLPALEDLERELTISLLPFRPSGVAFTERSATGGRLTSMGREPPRSILSATLPRNNRARPPRPWVSRAIKSTRWAA